MLIRGRYDHNDYKGFKTIVHDATHMGQTNPPPLPKATRWFSAFNEDVEDEDDDDDIVIAGVTVNLKCPLTLQLFRVPYKSSACKHVFEKDAIEDIIDKGGSRPARGAEKEVKCPTGGCSAVSDPSIQTMFSNSFRC